MRTKVLISFWLLVAGADGHAARPTEAARRLSEAVPAICRADYRGDREELARLARSLAAAPPGELASYQEYWVGFAYWRRAINGFNETPAPADVLEDLERCAARQRAALRLEPAFEDARAALAGCLSGEMYLAAQLTPEKKAEVYREGIAVFRALKERAEGNPRALWIVGGNEMWAPPPYGGDAARATATFRRGLLAARREALSPARREPWAPAWGAPEILMSLAYLHTAGAAPNAAAARAYAEGALAIVPDWHYVKDVLLPRIEALESPRPTGEVGSLLAPCPIETPD